MARELWEATFRLRNRNEVEVLRSFLKSRGDRRRIIRFYTRGNQVIIECGNEDAAFTVGQWLRHSNPLGELLFYPVKGYDADGRVIFDSGCPVCRRARKEGRIREVKHYAHRVAGKGEAAMKPLGTRTIEDGRVTVPEDVRKALGVREGGKVTFYSRYGRILLDKAPEQAS